MTKYCVYSLMFCERKLKIAVGLSDRKYALHKALAEKEVDKQTKRIYHKRFC